MQTTIYNISVGVSTDGHSEEGERNLPTHSQGAAGYFPDR